MHWIKLGRALQRFEKFAFTESIRTPISRHSGPHGHLVKCLAHFSAPLWRYGRAAGKGHSGSHMLVFIQIVLVLLPVQWGS